MCGVMAMTKTLFENEELEVINVELVQYSDSGESSGDTSQVVGYEGLFVMAIYFLS